MHSFVGVWGKSGVLNYWHTSSWPSVVEVKSHNNLLVTQLFPVSDAINPWSTNTVKKFRPFGLRNNSFVRLQKKKKDFKTKHEHHLKKTRTLFQVDNLVKLGSRFSPLMKNHVKNLRQSLIQVHRAMTQIILSHWEAMAKSSMKQCSINFLGRKQYLVIFSAFKLSLNT